MAAGLEIREPARILYARGARDLAGSYCLPPRNTGERAIFTTAPAIDANGFCSPPICRIDLGASRRLATLDITASSRSSQPWGAADADSAGPVPR